MLQNSEAPQVSCNQKDHSRQYIQGICTRKECDKQRALCSRCIISFHKSCDDHIVFLEDLPNKFVQKENEFGEVDHLIESLIQKLREIQQMYQKTVKPILEYKAVPNITNLNNVGTMFSQDQKIDLDSIRIGTQLIAGITESYLSLCKPKELSPQEQKDAEEWRRKCQDSYNKNEFQEAVEFIDRALSINPRSDVYWNWKGLALNEQKKYEEAIQCLDAALNINPKNDFAWNNKGFALIQQKKYEEAIQCLDAALNINPKNDSAWHNKGFALFEQKKYEEAIQCLDAALNINPKNDSAWHNKGMALNEQKKYEEAIQCLDAALSINPRSDVYWNWKGFALFEQKKYEEAIQCLDAALNINPKNDSAWNNKGFALNEQKKYEEAIKCYDQSLSIESSFLRYYWKSFPLESLNKLKEAEDCLIKALELNSNDQDSIDRLKVIQSKLKK